MYYCFEDGGHVVWTPLRQVVVAVIPQGNGRTDKRIVELVCYRHAPTRPRTGG